MKNYTLSPLGERIQSEKDARGMPLKDLTVLSDGLDPYRLDTASNHARAQWLANAYNALDRTTRIHLRGLHYALVGTVTKPDGALYINTDENWEWMSEKCAKPARFLGYIPWTAVRDNRNAAPQIFTPEFITPQWRLAAGEVELYLPDNIEPRFELVGDMFLQPCRQVVIAEKQGVEDLLKPVCMRRKTTLAMPTGEISSQMVYDILAAADEDGRPLVIHQLGDFDPAGWQMAVSTARKVQAIVDTEFPDLRVILHAIGLTKEQCVKWTLPTSPLKETERRGTKWKAAMGREQTELDAAVIKAEKPFANMVEKALLQYYDISLATRGNALVAELEEKYNTQLHDTLGEEMLKEIRGKAQEKLGAIEDMTEEINAQLRIDPDEIGMDSPPLPAADPGVLIGEIDIHSAPLIDTGAEWFDNTRTLINRKQYL